MSKAKRYAKKTNNLKNRENNIKQERKEKGKKNNIPIYQKILLHKI